MTSVLITGAAGFIGSHLARRVLAGRGEVHAVVRPDADTSRLSGDQGRLNVHRIDLLDPAAIADCLRKARPTRIFHLASATRRRDAADLSDAIGSVRSEIEPLLNLVQAAAAMPSSPAVLIRAGSLAEYGFVTAPPAEADRESPADAYSAGKVAGTHYLRMLQPRLLFPAMTARLGLVYGPGQAETFFAGSAFADCLAGREVHVRRPRDRRDLIHVEDVLDGFGALSARPRPGAIVNVGSGVAPTMLETAERIAAAFARPGSVRADAPHGPPRHLMLDTRTAGPGLGMDGEDRLRRRSGPNGRRHATHARSGQVGGCQYHRRSSRYLCPSSTRRRTSFARTTP